MRREQRDSELQKDRLKVLARWTTALPVLASPLEIIVTCLNTKTSSPGFEGFMQRKVCPSSMSHMK